MINTKLLAHANVLINKQNFPAAEKIYLEMLAKSPNSDIVMAFLGRLYIKMHRYKAAIRILEKAYKIRKTAPTVASLAFCKFKTRKFDDAIILYEELFKYDPDSIKIYERIIEAFRELEMFNFSHAYAQKLFMKYPDKENSYVRLTQSYMDLRDMKSAEDMCAKTIQKFPKSGAAWILAGNIQEYCYCNEEMAQDCYQTAIDYGSKTAWYQLAVTYTKVGRYKEAEECYKNMLKYFPNKDYVLAGLGMLYLTQREMKKGYEYFANREKSDEVLSLHNQWDGGNIENETLLLYCDHGFGDMIQYIRYLPLFVNKAKNIIVRTRPELLELFKKSYPKDKYPTVDFTDDISNIKYDKFVLSTDLPYYLDLDFDHIPYTDGYLSYDKEKQKYFKDKYFNTDKFKVGLCWRAGNFGMRLAINRTINIDYFKKIFDLKNIQYYSFQKEDIFDGCKKYPQMIDLNDELKDFDDTAAAMANVDLMISVDTANMHLAGALGKKTFLLIPYCSEWRWFDNTKKTEWYSSVEIFKQKERQDWFIETDEIYERLKELTK